jgi:hypothetical protein
MTDRLFLSRLLGSDAADPGCEGAFDVLDQYAEAVLRGEDTAATYSQAIIHVQNCPACREDTEWLLAALRMIEAPPPDR